MNTTTFAPPRPKSVTYGLDASIARITVPRYQKMIREGIFDVNDHVELLENYVVLKMSRNPKHDTALDQVDEALRPHKPNGWRFRKQSAIALLDSQPEPDFAFVRGQLKDFEKHHPTAADIALVIEIANSSLMRDRNDKGRIYARSGIPIYWIVNLVDNRIEAYTQPSGPCEDPEYASCEMFAIGQMISLTLDGKVEATLQVSELLG